MMLPHDGVNCLPAKRLNSIARGCKRRITRKEQLHLCECHCCFYLASNTDKNCFTDAKLIKLYWDDSLTEAENSHVRECPICAWEFQEITGKSLDKAMMNGMIP